MSSMRFLATCAASAFTDDRDRAVVFDVDHATGLFGQRADHRTTLADHVADLLRVDLHVDHARREVGHLFAMRRTWTLHLFQDVQACILGLGQRNLHDFLGDALDLDVHLQRGDAVSVPATLKSMSPR
jgi:hypothetical protein